MFTPGKLLELTVAPVAQQAHHTPSYQQTVGGRFTLFTLCLFVGLPPSSQIITNEDLILAYKCPALVGLFLTSFS